MRTGDDAIPQAEAVEEPSEYERYLLSELARECSNGVRFTWFYRNIADEMVCGLCEARLFRLGDSGRWPEGQAWPAGRGRDVVEHARAHFRQLGQEKVDAALVLMDMQPALYAIDVIREIWGATPPLELNDPL